MAKHDQVSIDILIKQIDSDDEYMPLTGKNIFYGEIETMVG